MRLYTNVPRNKAAPSLNRVGITHGLVSVHLRIVVHPHKKSFLCAPSRLRVVRRSVQTTHRTKTSKIIFNYLAPRNRLSGPTVRHLVRTSGKLSIAFRHTFSCIGSPHRTLRRLVNVKIGHILASNRVPATVRKTPLLTRLIGRTNSHVVVVPNYKIGRRGVTRLTHIAKTNRFRFSTHRRGRDQVLLHGPTLSVKNASVSRCTRPIAAPRGIHHAVRTLAIHKWRKTITHPYQ